MHPISLAIGAVAGGLAGYLLGYRGGVKTTLTPVARDPSLADSYVRVLNSYDPVLAAAYQAEIQIMRREGGYASAPALPPLPRTRPPALPPPPAGRTQVPPHAVGATRFATGQTSVPAGMSPLPAPVQDIATGVAKFNSLVAQGNSLVAQGKPNLAVANFKMAGALGYVRLSPLVIDHLGDTGKSLATSADAIYSGALRNIPTTFDTLWQGMGSSARVIGNGRASSPADAAQAQSAAGQMLSLYQQAAAAALAPAVAQTGYAHGAGPMSPMGWHPALMYR